MKSNNGVSLWREVVGEGGSEGVQEWLKNTELLTLELGWFHLIIGLLRVRGGNRRGKPEKKTYQQKQGRKVHS